MRRLQKASQRKYGDIYIHLKTIFPTSTRKYVRRVFCVSDFFQHHSLFPHFKAIFDQWAPLCSMNHCWRLLHPVTTPQESCHQKDTIPWEHLYKETGGQDSPHRVLIYDNIHTSGQVVHVCSFLTLRSQHYTCIQLIDGLVQERRNSSYGMTISLYTYLIQNDNKLTLKCEVPRLI